MVYLKDPNEAKYQYFIKKRENLGLKRFNNSEAFIEYLNDMDNIYKNIEEYNLGKKRKIVILFDDIIVDMISNKKRNPIKTDLFIGGRKVTISLALLQSYFFI